MTTAARRTFNALDQHYYQVGTDDPSSVATDGLAGSLYIQIPVYPAVSPIASWQKQDNGVSTNWTPFGGTGVIMDYKNPVRVASIANVNIAVAPASIDGVVLASGDRVLLKDQAAPAENGIYDYNGVGVAMTRSADADTDAEVTYGLFTWAVEGTVNQLTGWILVTPDPIVLDTTALSFVQCPIPSITSIGTMDSQPKSLNGAVILGTELIMQTATDTFPGLLSLLPQPIIGEKSFEQPIHVVGQAVAPGAAPVGTTVLYSLSTDMLLTQVDGAGNVRIVNSIIQGAGLDIVVAPQFINFIGVTPVASGLGVDITIPTPLSDGTEFRTVSAPEAAAEQLTLAATPDDPTKVTVSIGGVVQFYGDDYTVAGNLLSWTGLGMSLLPVAAGDKLVIGYNV